MKYYCKSCKKGMMEKKHQQKLDDLGGYWWPPTYSSWTPTTISFSFLVSLIVAQFTIFGSFQVLNFRSHFEALNNVFSASNGRANMSLFLQASVPR